MSLEQTASATGTPKLSQGPTAPVSRAGEEDAEFVEVPPTKPAKPAKPGKPTDARPLNVESVFGGKVADTPNAARRPAGGPQDAVFEGEGEPKKRGPGRPKKGEPKPPVVVTDKHRAAATAAVRTLEGLPKVVAARRYSTVFDESKLAAIDDALTYSDAERELLVGPLAQGAAENGLTVPWWAEFGFAAMMVTLPRFAMFSEFEKEAAAEWKRQGRGAPPPVKGEPS